MSDIFKGDSFEIMPTLPKVELILTDPPYGVTGFEWDKQLDLKMMWEKMLSCSKENCRYIFNCTQPFTSKLLLSNEKMFDYELIWEKSRISNPLRNKKEPSRIHENILVFSKGNPPYNPKTFFIEEKYRDKRKSVNNASWGNGQFKGEMKRNVDTGKRQPQSVVFFKSHWSAGMHPTQKPLELFKYLVETYSNLGDTVLDPFMGSGTTIHACNLTGRKGIGIEINDKYYQSANNFLNKEGTIL
jgi:site-specific DNA-methyltransferase (adenine-specific)